MRPCTRTWAASTTDLHTLHAATWEPALDDAAAKAAGATTMEAAIADAIAASEPRAAEGERAE
jgi:hypothetical protein